MSSNLNAIFLFISAIMLSIASLGLIVGFLFGGLMTGFPVDIGGKNKI